MDRNIWLADSFTGLPAPSNGADCGYDLSDNRNLVASLEEAAKAFQRFGLMDREVKFLNGWFKDTHSPLLLLAVSLSFEGRLRPIRIDRGRARVVL